MSSLSSKLRLQEVIRSLEDLTRVENLVRSTFVSEAKLIDEISSYLLTLGGKRIRPTLTLLCARALGENPAREKLIDVAAGIELIHMATLLHDDIIDESPLRRHKPSPLARFGVAPTLLSGDFLLVRAFGLCARLDAVIIQATEAACVELVEGECIETPLHLAKHSLQTSLNISKKKTASLFRLAAFSAAHILECSDECTALFSSFGENLGIAFQILDDILDVISDEETLGKKPGLDLIERKPSTVNVLWLESGAPNAKRLLTPPNVEQDKGFVQESLHELQNGPVIKEAKALAAKYADQSRLDLSNALKLSKNVDKRAHTDLETLIDFTLERIV